MPTPEPLAGTPLPSGAPWHVRRATAADVDDLVALSQIPPDAEAPGAVAARVANLLEDRARFFAVASSAVGLLGVAEAQFLGPAMRRNYGSARLHDLYVVPPARRRGVASALFAAVRAWAAEVEGCRFLEWQSSATGLAFYERMGLVANAENDTADHPYFEIEV